MQDYPGQKVRDEGVVARPPLLVDEEHLPYQEPLAQSSERCEDQAVDEGVPEVELPRQIERPGGPDRKSVV